MYVTGEGKLTNPIGTRTFFLFEKKNTLGSSLFSFDFQLVVTFIRLLDYDLDLTYSSCYDRTFRIDSDRSNRLGMRLKRLD